ncbi:DsrE family protein [Haloarchaeobius sp. DYHT-AS-18]|uniref:DsrE family protein n=1 Tax=Haloarchaeobius sp. DYHT-AS-18 TaxID=3446117 RepID=UPI003EBC2F53
MVKAAVVILAGIETGSDLGRLVNGLETSKEFADAGDELELVFDGAGTRWIPELENETHDFHGLYTTVKEHASACNFCANAFGVADEVETACVRTVDEYDGHRSISSLVHDGYEVLTF